ncbi:hypothetical protein M8818_001777 [Zalaria obscura]|uniref:Uncharacterized protein n=1 Tax=Zalaria obscura TaxID=2024903 RepID=A0ACC3SLC2_9PEZI
MLNYSNAVTGPNFITGLSGLVPSDRTEPPSTDYRSFSSASSLQQSSDPKTPPPGAQDLYQLRFDSLSPMQSFASASRQPSMDADRSSHDSITHRTPFQQPVRTITPERSQGVYVCEHPDCLQKGIAFKRLYDWRRHEGSVHSPKAFQCPMPGCTRRYSRKDKLPKHIREYHGV